MPRPRAPLPSQERTTLSVLNIHCPSCSASITALLEPMADVSHVAVNILDGTVSFSTPHYVPRGVGAGGRYSPGEDTIQRVIDVLGEAGFTLPSAGHGNDSIALHSSSAANTRSWWESKARAVRRLEELRVLEDERREAHLAICGACREGTDEPDSLSTVESNGKGKGRELEVVGDEARWETTLLVSGMTCSSCVSNVHALLSSHPSISQVVATLIPGRAVVEHSGAIKPAEIVEIVEDGGYEAILGGSKRLDIGGGWWETRILIEGMSCSSCINSLTSILSPTLFPGIRSTNVSLIPPLAVVVHDPLLISKEKLMEEIEDGGFGASVVESKEVESGEKDEGRKVVLRVDGMFCGKCVTAINTHLASLQTEGTLQSHTPLTLATPTTTISYIPNPPHGFTLRTLQRSIAALGPFKIHPIRANDALDQLSRQAQRREARQLGIRVALAFLFSIPTFIIAVVGMTLLSPTDPFRMFWETAIWGSASRGTIALWILATPVQFGVGSLFYTRAWKGVKGVWRRGGQHRWRDRMLRWGSMDSLVALGTSTAYFASLAFLIMDVRRPLQPEDGGMSTSEMSYFDTSVLLVLFILVGRLLEGIARRSTGEAVEALSSMSPVSGVLYTSSSTTERISSDAIDDDDDDDDDVDTDEDVKDPATTGNTQHVQVDFLEKGDILLVPVGSAVPLDSILLAHSPSSSFDESSLTGESLPVLKTPSSALYAGSTNLGPSPVIAQVTAGPGGTMIDNIVSSVRTAMGKKAEVERLADMLTGYFVPAVVGIAVFTLLVWIARGYAGTIPKSGLDRNGGFALFAIQFAVAVLVVSCPCGIGLAAPTAQMVGLGLASRLGIVPYGGGEAFQNATRVDCVVFDKTGTLTTGGFTVSDSRTFEHGAEGEHGTFWRILEMVEEGSSHPISTGLRTFCRLQVASLPSSSIDLHLLDSEEVPGRGLKARIMVGEQELDVLVGNMAFMEDHSAGYGEGEDKGVEATSLLAEWGEGGKSVVLVAFSKRCLSPFIDDVDHATPSLDRPRAPFHIVGLFGVQDPPRLEAALVVKQLEQKGIAVYMCSGDNPTTARAVARTIGIDPARVFAGVLPHGKKDVVEDLQRGGASDALRKLRSEQTDWRAKLGWRKKVDSSRARIMFVGDGINDILALTAADVGVSMGQGASVALSTSDFCLLSSNLLSLLTLLSLAQATFNKIISNFVWACLFNGILIPVAAGAFYDLGGTRLPPVWASLAMALSSVSVVVNSLLLKVTFKPDATMK